MTFDEALDELEPRTIWSSEMRDLLEQLRETYAPTIEMTKNQYWFITSEYEKESVVEAVANLTVDDIIKEKFHSNFWKPLSEKQVVQAWLHPETIKVVD
ncbi:hypothetical protein G9401_00330 [Weissella paramesenteroides]|uniref:hypothetical protein n=1 Tax=Weissella paramesenteroides TaxID=1249 RepID=UPI0023F77673|nr:hypothetical protein [Weissella paramesenteroides]MDF8374041.1 hypothetical protein [Weissella paramesenteroides]